MSRAGQVDGRENNGTCTQASCDGFPSKDWMGSGLVLFYLFLFILILFNCITFIFYLFYFVYYLFIFPNTSLPPEVGGGNKKGSAGGKRFRNFASCYRAVGGYVDHPHPNIWGGSGSPYHQLQQQTSHTFLPPGTTGKRSCFLIFVYFGLFICFPVFQWSAFCLQFNASLFVVCQRWVPHGCVSPPQPQPALNPFSGRRSSPRR